MGVEVDSEADSVELEVELVELAVGAGLAWEAGAVWVVVGAVAEVVGSWEGWRFCWAAWVALAATAAARSDAGRRGGCLIVSAVEGLVEGVVEGVWAVMVGASALGARALALAARALALGERALAMGERALALVASALRRARRRKRRWFSARMLLAARRAMAGLWWVQRDWRVERASLVNDWFMETMYGKFLVCQGLFWERVGAD